MSQKVKIEVEVEVEGPVGPEADAEKFTFVSLKVEGGQSIPLPPKDPAPKRLSRDLAMAAALKLGAKKSA